MHALKVLDNATEKFIIFKVNPGQLITDASNAIKYAYSRYGNDYPS